MAKRKKVKYKNIIKLILVLIIISLLFIKLTSNKLKIEINKTIPYDKDISFKAIYKDKDVTSNTTYDYKKDKLGNTKITFIYKDNKKEYKTSKKVKLIDDTNPVITLNGSDTKVIVLNSKYEEEGFSAIDNYDGDITDKVVITNDVDISKEGEYVIKYTVEDSSKNKAMSKRKVTVTSKNPLSMSVKEFTLNGFFDKTILKENKSTSDDYYYDTIFAGDSTALYYVINKQIYSKQLWHKEGMSIDKVFTQEIYIKHIASGLTMIEAAKEYKPKRMLLMLGTNSAAMELDYFASTYEKLIKELKIASPNTEIIVQSIFPVAKQLDDQGKTLNNDKINKMNYKLLEICDKLNIPFLNTAEVLKDNNGTLKDGYYRTDKNEYGVHLTEEANKIAAEYFENHMYEK